MQSENEGNRGSTFDEGRGIRNPFNVMDVPNPDDREVQEFAASAKLEEPRTMKTQRLGGHATAINMTRSKEIGPADGTVAWTARSRETPGTNGNRDGPK